jgi:hypothetical protein
MMTEARGASNEKAKRELGWKPRYASWRQGFARGLGVGTGDGFETHGLPSQPAAASCQAMRPHDSKSDLARLLECRPLFDQELDAVEDPL